MTTTDPRERFRVAFFGWFEHHDRSDAFYEAMLGIIDNMVTKADADALIRAAVAERFSILESRLTRTILALFAINAGALTYVIQAVS